MHLLVYGPGRLGTTVVAAARPPGGRCPTRRPARRRRRAPAPLVDVVVDASRGDAVLGNLEHACAPATGPPSSRRRAGRRTSPRVPHCLLRCRAAAVVAPNLSLGAALFLRLAEAAPPGTRRWSVRAVGRRWHRRGKADRPSGTARAIARRITAADPRWSTGTATRQPAAARGRRYHAGAAPARTSSPSTARARRWSSGSRRATVPAKHAALAAAAESAEPAPGRAEIRLVPNRARDLSRVPAGRLRPAGVEEDPQGLQTRELDLVEVETASASPFASSLTFDYVATYMYEDDTPPAERRARRSRSTATCCASCSARRSCAS